MNPLAKALRAELTEARVLLAVAIATENPPLILFAKNQIQSIMLRKKSLAFSQQSIITTANLQTKIKSARLLQNLRSEFQSYQRKFQFFLDLTLQESGQTTPLLAVRPDIAGDLAPVYETEAKFKSKQQMSTSWKINISSFKRWTENWLRVNSEQDFKCQASIKSEGEGWALTIER